MQRVVNCGSFLQAYGLKRIIESLGHQVVFIDYRIEKPICNKREDYQEYKKYCVKNLILDTVSNCPILFRLLPEEVRFSTVDRNKYKNEYSLQLGLSKKKNYNTIVDTVVIGSDEVFNCLQLNPEVGFSPELFGKNSNTSRLITYAASFGNTTLDAIISSGKASEIQGYLKRMDAISVRDDNSSYIVEKLTSLRPKHHLDPVLIYEFGQDISDIELSQDFIIVYAYRRRIRDDEANAIMKFAKQEKLKIISIGGYQPFCDENVNLSPFEVLGYFKKARYVFTDTFHGVIFSVISHKQFVVFVREGHGKIYGNAEKINGLLSDLGLTNRAVHSNDQITNTMKEEIDYCAVDTIIREERKKTITYLRENL